MRTIKFRGKRLDNQEWEQGNYVAYKEDDGEDVHCIVSRERNQIGASLDFVPVDPETVGQFTGLLDKNGKEIYEGDIVKSISGSLDVVSYDKIAFNLMTAYATAPNGTCMSFFGKNNPLKGIEVIGNIHDNQELLKTE